ncbi:MAG: enoyl-CoA hydratase/isomerase family protein [Gammaproteobacteria bacterium]|nr:enoyl-CoA hydratase/isomerase family protein [Gammaproteobacteria bacterium]MBI5616049.1 enoyl-CoA hydratase/isomerase family protein [Gammaproteobacteria bacterium]
MAEYEALLYRVEDAICWITINRPETLNALNVPTLLELEAALTAAEQDPAVHVIVFTGAGERAFVAGGDIADLDSRQGLPHYNEFAEVIHRVNRRVELCDKPTMAAVNGWALGGGTELVLCTDVRVASEKAVFGLPEITLGLFPGAGGSQRFIRQIAPCKAKELMFTGDRIKADEALELGLINHVVAPDQLVAKVTEIARKIAQKSSVVLKLLKRSMAHGIDMPMAAALQYEQAIIGLVLDSKDAHEGCQAFLQKRAAKFTGE